VTGQPFFFNFKIGMVREFCYLTGTICTEVTTPIMLRYRHRCMRIKGVRPHGKRKEIGVFVLEVPHRGKPFGDQNNRGPLDVSGNMGSVCIRHLRKILPPLQLLSQMKNRPEQFGKGICVNRTVCKITTPDIHEATCRYLSCLRADNRSTHIFFLSTYGSLRETG
jgi:hypothetical protein